MPEKMTKEDRIISMAIEKAKEENAKLKDEVDSLWAMMDEMTKSDIQNWSHLMEELKADVVTRALMVTKKKADC